MSSLAVLDRPVTLSRPELQEIIHNPDASPAHAAARRAYDKAVIDALRNAAETARVFDAAYEAAQTAWDAAQADEPTFCRDCLATLQAMREGHSDADEQWWSLNSPNNRDLYCGEDEDPSDLRLWTMSEFEYRNPDPSPDDWSDYAVWADRLDAIDATGGAL